VEGSQLGNPAIVGAAVLDHQEVGQGTQGACQVTSLSRLGHSLGELAGGEKSLTLQGGEVSQQAAGRGGWSNLPETIELVDGGDQVLPGLGQASAPQEHFAPSAGDRGFKDQVGLALGRAVER
jgi:hypothetical protein